MGWGQKPGLRQEEPCAREGSENGLASAHHPWGPSFTRARGPAGLETLWVGVVTPTRSGVKG